MKRNRRAGVEDRWTKTVRDAHGNTPDGAQRQARPGMRWRARYVDDRPANTPRRSPARPMRRPGWQRGHSEAGHRHLRRAGGGPGDRGCGVCVVVGVAGPHLRQDGRDPAQCVEQPRRTAMGRCGGGRCEDVGGAGVGGEDGAPMGSARRRSRTHSGCCARCSAPQSRTAVYPATRARVCGCPSASTPTAAT